MKPARYLSVVVALVLPLAASAFPAVATHNGDRHSKMDLLFTSPNSRINSDLAFWGNYAVQGYYRNDMPVGGFRIFDISNPSAPTLIRDFPCDGLQADPILWDRDGSGIPDLLLLAVDRTMESPECGAPRVANGDPDGWEGVRVFTLSDDPADPFADIEQVKAVYTDCGAHTITLYPGLAGAGELIVYVSSYPLRPGPTCGTENFDNVANPYDEDPGSPASPLHGVIQVVEVPLADPADAEESSVQPALSYPGDPDGVNDWCERSVTGPGEPCPIPGAIEPAAIACHDIVVHVAENMAGGACAEQGQVWEIDPTTGIPDTEDPMLILDDEFSSGGTGNIPGAVDFFHSVMFNNAGTVVNLVDESFGEGCPPMTEWRDRPWHPGVTEQKSGRMFFSDTGSGDFLSEFQVGDLRPEATDAAPPGAAVYCSAHMGMAVMGSNRDLLVNAWYTGGVDVIDFTEPTKPKEIAYYDIAGAGALGSDNWSAYPYTGPKFPTGRGIPVYASDGVHHPDSARGTVVFRTILPNVGTRTVDHLNPQTMD